LVEELRPERSLSRNPLFQVMFVLQDETSPDLTLPGISVTGMPVGTSTAKFELALGVVEKAEGMDVWLSYSTDLFEPASIAAMLDDYKLVLESIVRNRGQHLSDLPTLCWTPQASSEGKNHAANQRREQISLEPSTSRKAFVGPRTPVEERLVGIWSEVLRVEQVSVHANFFELGGHSLLAAQVISRVRNMFSAELPLRRLFEMPTIAGLAKAIYEIQTAETEDDELVAMLSDLSQLSEEEAQQRFAEER
jgi:non-ribosomal peptide synthetase component F